MRIKDLQIIVEQNQNKTPNEISKIIKDWCCLNKSINDVETKVMNKSIKVEGYHFIKRKGVLKFVQKQYKSKSESNHETNHETNINELFSECSSKLKDVECMLKKNK